MAYSNVRAYTCILAFFRTQLGVTHVSFDFVSPSNTTFLSSEKPYFGSGETGGLSTYVGTYVYVRTYLRMYAPPPVPRPKYGFLLDRNVILEGEEQSKLTCVTPSCVQKDAKMQV